MTIRDMRYFVEIVKENSFSKAAQNLFIAEATISHQIKRLEQKIGLKLFIRSSRKIELTEAGNILFQRASEILDSYDSLCSSLDMLSHSISNGLSVGMVPVMHSIGFMQTFHDFSALHPEISADLQIGSETDLFRLLENGQIDLAIVKMCDGVLDFFNPDIYEKIVLRKEHLYILMAESIAPAGRTELSLKDVEHYPIITDKIDSFYYYVAERHYTNAGLKLNQYPIQTNNIETILMVVEEGKAIAFASESVSEYYRKHYKLRSFRYTPTVDVYISLIYLKKHILSKNDKLLIEYLKKRV